MRSRIMSAEWVSREQLLAELRDFQLDQVEVDAIAGELATLRDPTVAKVARLLDRRITEAMGFADDMLASNGEAFRDIAERLLGIR